MTDRKPVNTFRVEVETDVSPEAIYAVLSDPSTHLIWGGKEAPDPRYRLLEMKAPPAPATVGTTWTSTGANSRDGSSTFYDDVTVVRADAPKAFGFNVESKLDRKNGKTWYCHFEHLYTIERTQAGSRITYIADVFPKNYRPYWLFPAMRPMTRFLVNRANRAHIENLARMARAGSGISAS